MGMDMARKKAIISLTFDEHLARRSNNDWWRCVIMFCSLVWMSILLESPSVGVRGRTGGSTGGLLVPGRFLMICAFLNALSM